MGFCRTNLFKRLESSGPRSLGPSSATFSAITYTFTAIDNDLPLPLGRRIQGCSI